MSSNARTVHGKARGTRQAPPQTIEVVDLTRLIEETIEAHRQRALDREVRLACCMLDDFDVAGCGREIETRLRTMLSAAVDGAVPGTHVECSAAAEKSGVVVRLRFLRPFTRSAGNAWEINGCEIIACWPLVER